MAGLLVVLGDTVGFRSKRRRGDGHGAVVFLCEVGVRHLLQKNVVMRIARVGSSGIASLRPIGIVCSLSSQ